MALDPNYVKRFWKYIPAPLPCRPTRSLSARFYCPSGAWFASVLLPLLLCTFALAVARRYSGLRGYPRLIIARKLGPLPLCSPGNLTARAPPRALPPVLMFSARSPGVHDVLGCLVSLGPSPLTLTICQYAPMPPTRSSQLGGFVGVS